MNNSNNGAIGQQQPQISNQPTGGMQLPGMASAIEHYRLSQLYQYAMAAERLRCPPGSQSSLSNAAAFFPPIPTGLRPELAPFLYSSYCRIDPRLALCRPPDEPKPQHSYIGLIAMAILGSPDKKLVLSDIYQYILDNYPYFRSRGPGWRNSIRHNLSLNDCFVKSGRSANGKGHYWAIHPANIDDFTKGDFRRRKAQRKVRRHMGLAVDDPDSPSPPPVSPPPVNWPDHPLLHPHLGHRHLPPPHFALNPHPFALTASNAGPNFEFGNSLMGRRGPELLVNSTLTLNMNFNQLHREKKRQFDVASLLAPENNILSKAPSGVPVSPASTSKSVKSDEDCDIEQCFSRTPSPISPICKTLKKMSPANSEDEPISDDDGKGGRKRSAKNSSDEDEQAAGTRQKCSGNFIPKNTRSSPTRFGKKSSIFGNRFFRFLSSCSSFKRKKNYSTNNF